jgi:hypothetical protein
MPDTATGISAETEGAGSAADAAFPRMCTLVETPVRAFAMGMEFSRMRAIVSLDHKWLNGTVLHYYFFDRASDGRFVHRPDGSREWRSWVGADDQKQVVRAAFRQWKELDIGLEFVEVNDRGEAELRIGFEPDDGSWCYLGTHALQIGVAQRTMNFGWRLTGANGRDTALHEIGHALGLPHEHQNPHAGIVWDEEAVYAALARAPNGWSREQTYYNIIRKIDADAVQGSTWDPDSVMHYPFGAGLIREPQAYRAGLFPPGNLSARDRAWVKIFYPPLEDAALGRLVVGRPEVLPETPGLQLDVRFDAPSTRSYTFGTFGDSDTLLAVFERDNGELRYLAADDDSGERRNARIEARLRKGREYVLRVRVKYAGEGAPFVMVW